MLFDILKSQIIDHIKKYRGKPINQWATNQPTNETTRNNETDAELLASLEGD